MIAELMNAPDSFYLLHDFLACPLSGWTGTCGQVDHPLTHYPLGKGTMIRLTVLICL